ncbi:hypothetical protein [Clostridium culturomicium]|uniref:hypothetical protein n=1 Tax=Clostridium culturomicium TaxID=1499683 RepID=UPI0038574271
MRLSQKIKKEEVYYFTGEVKKLLELISGIGIICDDKDKVDIIENQVNKIEGLLYKYEPTIYEEYSMKTKRAYINMVNAKKEYDVAVANRESNERILEYKTIYENEVKEYERLKEYRNKLKTTLIEN